MELILYIPEKIHVGYQERSETTTGLLSFPVGENTNGTLINERIWSSWCRMPQKDIFNNKPMSGFIVQKNVEKHSAYSSEKFRIFHPEGYEFEISTANMIYIMKHTDISKSEILAECVLSWKRDKLFLLPTNAQPYITHSINQKITDRVNLPPKESLVPGYGYEDSKRRLLIYVGEFKIHIEKTQKIETLEQNIFDYLNIKKTDGNNKFNLFDGPRAITINLEDDYVSVFYNPLNEKLISLKRTLIKNKINSMNIPSDELESLIATAKEINYFKKVEIIKADTSNEELQQNYLSQSQQAICLMLLKYKRSRTHDEKEGYISTGYLKSKTSFNHDVFRRIYVLSKDIYPSDSSYKKEKLDLLYPIMTNFFGKSYSRSYFQYLLLYCLIEKRLINFKEIEKFKFNDDELYKIFDEEFYLIEDNHIFQKENEEITVIRINKTISEAPPLLSIKSLKAIISLYLESADTQEMDRIKTVINNSTIQEIIMDEAHLIKCIESVWEKLYASNIDLSKEFGDLKIIEKDSAHKTNPLTFSIASRKYENLYELFVK